MPRRMNLLSPTTSFCHLCLFFHFPFFHIFSLMCPIVTSVGVRQMYSYMIRKCKNLLPAKTRSRRQGIRDDLKPPRSCDSWTLHRRSQTQRDKAVNATLNKVKARKLRAKSWERGYALNGRGDVDVPDSWCGKLTRVYVGNFSHSGVHVLQIFSLHHEDRLSRVEVKLWREEHTHPVNVTHIYTQKN